MLNDSQLEIISSALVPLFNYLEKEVIADIARRIQNTLAYSRTAELKAISMRELGYSPAKIRNEAMKLLNADPEYKKMVAKNTREFKRKVQEMLGQTEKEVRLANKEIISDAADMSWSDDMQIWDDAGRVLSDDSFLPQLIDSFTKQTAGELKNLTQTTGFKTMSGYESIETAYKRELDKAAIKICSGTFSRDKVLGDVVHDLAKSGLRSIDFASGYSMQLDTAARLAIRTGCHQLAGKITDGNIEKTGENLVYVSEHWGARNTGTGHANHEQWQGKVYYIKPGHDYREEAERIGQAYITDLWYATGYSVDGAHENDPLGLDGYNCRHRRHPWFEGISTFPKTHPEPEPVTINGKTYDYYAMTQKMRSMERAVRALKREREALKELGMDAAEIKAKIKRKTAEYLKFCEQCKVKDKSERLRYECGTSDLKKTKAWNGFDVSVVPIKKVIADSPINDTIEIANDEKVSNMTEIFDLGRINTEILEKRFGKIQTDEVIITSERKEHIRIRHPEDYELFERYGQECLKNPDLIVSDENNVGTVYMIKQLENTNLNVVLRLVLECDDSRLKNSVMTFWRIRNRNIKKLIEKNELLYKKE